MLEFMRGVVKRGAYFSALFVYLFSTFLAVILVLIPPKAMAAGAPIFEMTNGEFVTASRQSANLLELSARMKVTEDGYFGLNDTFAIFTIKLQLSFIDTKTDSLDVKQDYWKINKITFHDLVNEKSYGDTDSKIVSESIIELYNKNKELVARIDYTKLPNDPNAILSNDVVPCFQVATNNPNLGNRIAPKYGSGANCENAGQSGGGSNRTSPVRGLAIAIEAQNTTVNNYDLKGNPVDTIEGTKIKAWFSGTYPGSGDESNRIPLIISGKPGTSEVPRIVIPADSSKPLGGRPEITFTLSGVAGTYTSYESLGLAVGGAGGFAAAGPIGAAIFGALGAYAGFKSGSNMSWTIFTAVTSGGEKLEYFYVLGDNKGPDWHILYAPGLSSSDPYVKKEDFIADINMRDDGSPIHPKETTYHELYRHLNDEPPENAGESCKNGVKFETGPSINGQSVKLTRIQGDVSTLNFDCLNDKSTGWAASWGVKVFKEGANLFGVNIACGVGDIINFSKGIGEIFRVLLDCMIKEIFTPAVEWAADLIKYAAGLSYYNNPNDRRRAFYTTT